MFRLVLIVRKVKFAHFEWLEIKKENDSIVINI